MSGTIYVFSSWSGSVTNSAAASTTVYMDAAKTVTAQFTPFLAC